MDRKLINPQIVTNIADAIRAKKGTSSPIVVSDLANEIASIEGMPTSTKDLATLVGGSTASDEISTNNDFAKGLTDTPSEYKFKEQTTANGGSIKDTIAFVDRVKGNCIKFNQLLLGTDIANDLNSWTREPSRTFTINGDFVTIGVTSTTSLNNGLISSGINFLSGHKYLIFCIIKSVTLASTSRVNLKVAGYSALTNVGGTTSGALYKVFTMSDNATKGINISLSSGTLTDEITLWKPMVFDLTAMGMESITTPTELANALGYASENDLPFYDRQSETIVLNSKNKSICSKSRNLWDEVWELGGILDNGEKQASDTNIRSKNYNAISGNSVYIVSSNRVDIVYYDASKTFISKVKNPQNRSTSIPTNASYFLLTFSTAYGTTYLKDTAIFEGTTAQEYVPYFSDNLLTLVGNDIFPNGLCSAGEVRDELDLANGIATKKIGYVKLKDLTFGVTSGNVFYNTTLNASMSPIKPQAPLCAKYNGQYITGDILNNISDKGITIYPNGALYIKDSGYSDVASFTAHFTDDDLLYFALATPTTTTISKAKAYYKVSANGKEIAVSEGLSAPLVADIAYRGMSAEDLINAING